MSGATETPARAFLDILVDPIDHAELHVAPEAPEPDVLRGAGGRVYAIKGGIPRLVVPTGDEQQQTSDAFAFKWKKVESYDTESTKANAAEWMTEKYGFSSLAEMVAYFNGRRRILDVGCGAGFSASVFLTESGWTGDAMYVGADISGAIDVARDRLADCANTRFVQADALALPFADGSFDTVFSEGVLHHTPSTREGVMSCARVLASGGEMLFYVYRRKGPVREFTDDYLREALADMSDEEAWEHMRALTRLARSLAAVGATVTVEEDVPLLGIQAGTHDVQRFIYWNFAKLFWNDRLTFEGNVNCNFDWYRPHYAHRHTEEEVREFCAAAGLSITWFHEQESGFTVRASKP